MNPGNMFFERRKYLGLTIPGKSTQSGAEAEVHSATFHGFDTLSWEALALASGYNSLDNVRRQSVMPPTLSAGGEVTPPSHHVG